MTLGPHLWWDLKFSLQTRLALHFGLLSMVLVGLSGKGLNSLRQPLKRLARAWKRPGCIWGLTALIMRILVMSDIDNLNPTPWHVILGYCQQAAVKDKINILSDCTIDQLQTPDPIFASDVQCALWKGLFVASA
ncbi:hypothetical protein JB92DRAFT_2834157 [Gautieria morchelliformis]|nr:hypothetical protein JB92DRAFT_2834157 [Gautieria morchelliformis]